MPAFLRNPRDDDGRRCEPQPRAGWFGSTCQTKQTLYLSVEELQACFEQCNGIGSGNRRVDFPSAGLNSIVWVSTDSQYVQEGINEWMPNWKRNGWKNSKKAGIANKSLWLQFDTEIARHRLVTFSWVKAHSGILLNEIADTLATR
jgi:hypothetical protein